MKAATKKLIACRPGSLLVEVQSKKYKGAKLNKCFQNSAFFCASKNEYSVVSGWLVGDDMGTLGSICVPHYWVVHSSTGDYYDTSPTGAVDIQNYDYVLDLDIYRFANATSYVPPPIRIHSSNVIQAVLGVGNYVELDGISVDKLYSLVRL